jgi:type I restriction-modification system DNA methylase subunit
VSKKKAENSPEPIFPEFDGPHNGDSRRRRNLFLPRLLEKDSIDQRLRDQAQQEAYTIMQKWADLEERGKLQAKKETALESEFVTEVFGKALGYTLFSENKDQWNLELKYGVNGGEADAAIGMFEHGRKNTPVAVIELKGPQTDLDRHRFNGRTAVRQCWDYLNALPDCPWGIVSNFVSIRIYHRNHTPNACQIFQLRDLRSEETFRQFYYVFERRGLLPEKPGVTPRAVELLIQTGERQKEVGDELYSSYDRNRRELIQELMKAPHRKTLDQALRIAQKILDRIIFVAFCEDRGLLKKDSIEKACREVAAFDLVTNPKWGNFLNLFRSIDEGNKREGISPFNGGLFRIDPEVDNLQIDDQWTDFFNAIGRFDFRDEVNVEVLGHLFEKSIKDIERIKLGGLFDAEYPTETPPKMKKSAERKRFGVYYTPAEFTSFIVEKTIGELIDQRFEKLALKHKLTAADFANADSSVGVSGYWNDCLESLKGIRIVDPACGSGAFLIKAYDLLEEKYSDVIDQLIAHGREGAEKLRSDIPDMILRENIYGVDLSMEAVEITQLALWIRSAQEGKTLADLSKNIVHGNSLVSDQKVHPNAMIWEDAFPDIFSGDNPGFDCVIGNPPWERMKMQEREFFDSAAPEIASSVSAADRRKLISQLEKSNPDLHSRYEAAKEAAERTLTYIRLSGRFPLTAKGDINTYAVFAELAHTIAAPTGRVGLLVPSGIATDQTTSEFFGELVNSKALLGFYDFENRKKVFPDVDSRYKFCVLLSGGSKTACDKIDFVFFAHAMDELSQKKRHISLSVDDIKLLNPNTRTCPIFRSNRDAEITRAIYRRVPVLIDKSRNEGGNPWNIKFLRMFDQTNDAELFVTEEELKAKKYKRNGARWEKGKKVFLPLYEAKMYRPYDHRFGSVYVKKENWMIQGQTSEAKLVDHQNPEFAVTPRWWIDSSAVSDRLGAGQWNALLSFRDIARATDTRTMIASFIPYSAVLNAAPLILTNPQIESRAICCLLANFNSIPLDFVARQKVGHMHLNFFIVEQLPTFPPDTYSGKCRWYKKQTLEKWISDRVLKLTCTSNDMIPLAEAAGFEPPVHKWNPEERAKLMAELDAAYFILYGIDRDDVEYILSTFQGLGKRDADMFGGADTATLILSYYDEFLAKSQESGSE